ncbi:MAG: DNA-directed RNA polymerase subunit omega [Lactobacillus sp.]|jgi:DNA-directed RNA polymerase subunit omega|uniref:DNA-directed RNA polymerase subunit omega n=1 Tax=Lacticaseibacillus suilingensis TaxID=2799577 RepID=A0ABW4BGL4_9LACO|nr:MULTISPECIES: DNA-directed RNA polymerase subunit omega [Lacticaseibacillus]MCI1894589.1 DNA-directed RNA polymerase subunit omega [Lactobacillus sp.]MCI1918116.1 DNA-directed RNA polymerase subunit omega [Lactobacillus sp.]MCI1940703.1 DNA-directed RNA polymerase subunit omega [Lactobacillus sp.]MCI1971389.1 DNA-directed RNA polymerase subunit omega [Lactobacillus sp.]MCI2016524.1 DNA-directed RNA polymerase subunit omega [Lactobacillus sp.]
MIIYPSIDKLLAKIPSRYSLAVLAAKRAHELESGSIKMLPEYRSLKKVGQALEEVAAGDVIIDPDSKLLERDAEKLDHKD